MINTHYTSENRLQDALNEGARIINSIFNFNIPTENGGYITTFAQNIDGICEGDIFYRELTYFLCGGDGENKPTNYAVENRAFVNDHLDLAAVSDEVSKFNSMNDRELIDATNDVFLIKRLDLLSTFNSDTYIWFKINHAWWELVASFALAERQPMLSQNFFRNPNYYELSSCENLIMRCLQLLGRKGSDIGEINYVFDNLAFSISFNAGHLWHSDLVDPLPPFMRGAMLGAAPFFKVATSGNKFILADGAAAKKLAYGGQLRDFCDLIRSWSDVIVFITPDHLKQISLLGYKKSTINIVVPATKIHELWPATIVYVASVLNDVIKTYRCITIMLQAAVISAPISTMVAVLARETDAKIRLYDLGQVLDLAEPLGRRTHKWAKDLEQFPEYANAHVGCFHLA